MSLMILGVEVQRCWALWGA